MSLFQGDPLPNIETTKNTETSGPEWYTNYLQKLSQPGADLLGKTGEELVAPMTGLQTSALQSAAGDLSHYKDMLGKAGESADLAAKGVTPELIQSYMNPYTSNVVDEMGRLQQQNLQRSMLPSLKTAFAGSGGFGSSRMGGALGQALADMQANLTGQQQKALETGYNKALDTAMGQAGLYRSAAETQRGIASTDLDAATKALEEQYGLGSKQQQYEQSKILAPISAAQSAANVYANLKVPSTVSETSNAPIPGAYATSPLAQIAGLGSLFAAGSNGTSAAQGVLEALFGKGATSGSGGFLDWIKNQMPQWGDNSGGGDATADQEQTT